MYNIAKDVGLQLNAEGYIIEILNTQINMDNIHYDNQRIYCENNKVPFFASSSCDHMYGWVNDERYGNTQTLTEMLIERYGDEQAFIIASSSHITSCPGCCRSWCD